LLRKRRSIIITRDTIIIIRSIIMNLIAQVTAKAKKKMNTKNTIIKKISKIKRKKKVLRRKNLQKLLLKQLRKEMFKLIKKLPQLKIKNHQFQVISKVYKPKALE